MLQLSQKVHTYSHCPNKKKKRDDYDDKSKSIKEGKTSIKNMSKDIKKSNKTVFTLQAKILELKEDESDLSDSGGESHADFFLLKEN